MFNVNNYRVSFYYTNNKGRKYTTCVIMNTTTGDINARKSVRFNPNDGTYFKNEGRKRSLARALEFAGFNKEQRTEFWNAYKERRGDKGFSN